MGKITERNLAIHCSTIELAEKVNLLLGNRDSFVKDNWNGDELCFYINNQYSSITYAKVSRYPIVTAEEFIAANTIILQILIFN